MFFFETAVATVLAVPSFCIGAQLTPFVCLVCLVVASAAADGVGSAGEPWADARPSQLRHSGSLLRAVYGGHFKHCDAHAWLVLLFC